MTTNSWRLKLERAREHAKAFNEEAESWVAENRNSYGTIYEADEDPRFVLVKVIEAPEPPARWSAIIGDAIHNYRSALDHIMWALASKQGEAWDRTQFPMATTFEAWTGNNVTKSIKQFSGRDAPELIAYLYFIQPFHGWDEAHAYGARAALVAALLDNDDKHRALVPVAFASEDFGFQIAEGAPSVEVFTGIPLKPGNKIARIGPIAESHANPEGYLVADIAFASGVRIKQALKMLDNGITLILYELEPYL